MQVVNYKMYRPSGNVAVGVYGVGAGFSERLINSQISRVATGNGHPEEIGEDKYLAHIGIAFAMKHCTP